MLYQEYKLKLSKRMETFEKVWHFRFLILLAIVLIIAIIATLLGITGIIYSEVYPDTIVYGEDFLIEAKAIFRRTSIEYRAKGTQAWTENKPLRAGEYEIRVVSKNITGAKKYGEIHTCSVLPLEVELTIENDSLVYGETPSVSAQLVYADTIASRSFTYDWVSDTQCLVTTSVESVVDGDGENVTDCYRFVGTECPVTFALRPVTITVEDAVKTYDGTPLRSEAYHISSGSIAEEDELRISFPEQIVRAGEISNVPTYSIVNSKGEEVTNHYQISMQTGKLKVERREIFLSSGSSEKVYDATEFSLPGFVDTEEVPIVNGHRIEVASYTVVTDVGVYENNVEAYILAHDNEDVTDCYEIHYVNTGTLTITPRPLSIITDSYSWMYDGQSHAHGEFHQSGLVEGHYTQMLTQWTEVKDVTDGVENTLYVAVADEEDRDVTSNYEISYEFGSLVVTPKPLSIITGSYSWMYDGHPHSYRVFEELGLIDGHYLGSLMQWTEVKDVTDGVENILKFVVLDENANEVTANYEISYEYGTLVVTPRPITIRTDSAFWVYDGEEHSLPSGEVISEVELVEGHHVEAWGEVTFIRDVGRLDNRIERFGIWDENSNNVTANYKISYEYGTLEITPRPITVLSDSETWVYDGEYHALPSGEVISEVGLVDHHELRCGLISTSIKDVGQADNVIDVIIVDLEESRDVTSNYKISYEYGKLEVIPRPIIVQTESQTWVYDGAEHSCTGGTIQNMVYSHTWRLKSASTIRDVGRVDNILEYIILDENSNEVTANYHITYEYGTLEVTPRPITIRTGSRTWIYDGEAHSNEEGRIVSGLPVFGHTWSVSGLVTTIKDVGSIENRLTFAILDEDSNDVTANYEISYAYGKLKVIPRPIIVQSGSQTWVYDGEAHSYAVGTSETLVKRHTLVANGIAPTIRDVGSIENRLAFVILDENSNDVTANYEISYKYGTLEITPRPLTILTADKVWPYDGEYHSCGEGASDELVKGHTLVLNSATTTIREIGQVENRLAFLIWDANSNDVTANYEISYVYGTLEVVPRTVVIWTISATWIYDGQPHSLAELEEDDFDFYGIDIGAGFELMKGHTLELTSGAVTDVLVDVGCIENHMEFRIIDGEGHEQTDKYDIQYEWGLLEILKRQIEITSISISRKDTGSSLRGDELGENSAWISQGVLVQGHTLTYEITGELHSGEVGKKGNNTIEAVRIYDEAGRDVTDNYDISYCFGTLQWISG